MSADDCSLDHDGVALPLAQARAQLLARMRPVAEAETLPLASLLGRVLAAPVHAPIDVPGFTNAAMDGYALRAVDAVEGARLRLVGTAWAGRPLDRAVGPGEAARIFTGAPLPDGANSVLMQEHADASDGMVVPRRAARASDHVRLAGEDIPRGSVALAAGCRLRAPEIGVLASLGFASAPVLRRLRVAVVTTGDELVAPGQPLGPGQIHDSNSATLRALLESIAAEVVELGRVADDPTMLERVLHDAAGRADAIVSSGGVSVGEADFVTDTVRRIGELHQWKVAIKPGRPLALGRIGNCWFFGLPGNPVSVMATFHQLVQPALQKLMGLSPRPPLQLRARLLTPLKKKPGRMEFQRGVLGRDDDGRPTVASTGAQGSAILSSMVRADCYIVLDAETGPLPAGVEVDVQPFAGFNV